jgi:hypothetical protein
MNPDFLFALYVFCMDYHSGQWSRLYRIGSRIGARGIRLPDHAIHAIQGNRHTKKDHGSRGWDEWESSRTYYRQLKRKYANDAR